MEQLIPILSIVGYFIYQAYVGYQKEQEKAAKRNMGKPTTSASSSSEPKKEKKDWLEELLQPSPSKEPANMPLKPAASSVESYEEPKYKSTYQKQKYVPSEVPVSLLAEYRRLNTYEESEVSKKSRKVRNDKRAEIKRIETRAHEQQDMEWEDNQIKFDLREAIVIKAILERPYQ